MKAYSGWQRKFILLFKSEKRLGAANIINDFNDKGIEELKASIITEAMCEPNTLTNKPRTNDLQAHLDNLKHQFIGQSELCFYHATLVVLLRRDYKVDKIFAEFAALWAAETDYLLDHLSLRWIISACDSFIDHSEPIRAAILMNVTSLMTTLRVYETELFLRSAPSAIMTDKVEALYHSDLPLYDGLTYFRVGTDDTLKNMRRRYEQFYDTDRQATTMLLSVFDKLQSNRSAFATMRSLHKSDKSNWWLEP